MTTDPSNDTNNSPATATDGRRYLIKGLKILGWTVFAVILIFIVTCSAVVWFLHPDRLTPIAEKLASESLNADVTIGRAELTFWSSFPRVKLDVEDLTVVSHALDSLPADIRATLPAGADSLLSAGHFNGSVNLLKIINGEIALNDVIIDRPRINLLQVNDSVANFNIIPPSQPDSTKSPIPDISINHFAITNARPFTYRSIADSIDVGLQIHTIDLADKGVPRYQLTFDTNIDTPLLRDFDLESSQVSLDASISWSGKDPYRVGLSDFIFKYEQIDVVINTVIDFRDDLRIDDLDIDIRRLDINYIRQHLPPSLRKNFETLETDMALNLNARLKKPLVLSDSIQLPCMETTLEVPECFIRYGNADFRSFATSVTTDFRGDSLDLTTVDIDHVIIDGRAVDINLKGNLSDIFRDPHFAGTFAGSIDFNRLPSIIRRQIPGTIRGRLDADNRLDFRLSDFHPNRFHRLHAKGTMTLSDFRFLSSDTLTGLYTRRSRLDFGSSEKIAGEGSVADSLLVIKLSVDTARFFTEGIDTSLRDLKAGIGSTNRSSSSDTTRINPFGGGISFARLTYLSINDSTKLTLRDTRGIATLRRFKDNDRVPELSLGLDAGRLRIADPAFGATLRNSHVAMTAHLNPRRRRRSSSATVTAVVLSTEDSVARANRRRERNKAMTSSQLDSLGVETMDFDIDNSFRSLLRRWKLEGSITSTRGRLRIPSMRLRNSFRNLEFSFSTDSISLANLDYRMGRSDFHVNGSVSNILQALNRRRPGALKLDLNVVSDTIHVNQIVQALTAPRPHATMPDILDDSWEESEEEFSDYTETDSVMRPILVPVNIDAAFRIRAKNVIYSDMLLKRFTGDMMIYHGVLSLHNLSAATEAGSINLSALYSAPTVNQMQIGFGLALKDFHIGKLDKIVPGIDSILPMLTALYGLVDARIAATADIRPDMDIDMASLRAAMHFDGDSLVVFDNKTFRTLSKWLMFKNKERNMIDSLSVELTVEDNTLQIYPFIFNIDRYKLGVMGYNDLSLNLNYHISVLKSPVPFKFGINIKGDIDNPKIRLGGAKFKDKTIAEHHSIADTTRVNLVRQMSDAFRRGIRAARLGPLEIKGRTDDSSIDLREDTISHSDSLMMIREGLIEAPDTIPAGPAPETNKKKKKNRK